MGLFRATPYSPKHSSAGRFWGFNRIKGADDGKETVYMTRMWVWRLRIHIFHRGDQDPDCHDHPWNFWTFPLRSYREEVLHVRRDAIPEGTEPPAPRYFRSVQTVKAFRLHYRPAEHLHRVLGPAHGNGLVPTIVWRGDAGRSWGFMKERRGIWCWVPWKKYVYEGGKNAACE